MCEFVEGMVAVVPVGLGPPYQGCKKMSPPRALVLSEPTVDVDQDLSCPLLAGGAEGGLGLVEGELGAD
jgi:hypothetical protein